MYEKESATHQVAAARLRGGELAGRHQAAKASLSRQANRESTSRYDAEGIARREGCPSGSAKAVRYLGWFRSEYRRGGVLMKDDPARFSVLIVEDSAVVRRRLRSMLNELEHIRAMSEASNAPDAMRKVETGRPDFVILDVRLANGTSGLEVLKHIRDISHPCTTIMLTNLAHEEVQQECMSLGADHFFNKATEFERVVEVLSSARAPLMQTPAR